MAENMAWTDASPVLQAPFTFVSLDDLFGAELGFSATCDKGCDAADVMISCQATSCCGTDRHRIATEMQHLAAIASGMRTCNG